MTTLEATIPVVNTAKLSPRRISLFALYSQLSKARLSMMVLVTTAVGYWLAPWINMETGGWAGMGWTILGTGLLASGASTFNQIMEIDRDGLMDRTRNRPLPSGRISPLHALVFGLLCTAIGLGIMIEKTTALAAALGLVNVVLYAFIYTPLKTRTSLNTLVGAVVGALPPMMGWAAASGELTAGAYLLGALLMIWQIPHFLALAWMYKADYARGGYRMLPAIDPTGRLTGVLMVRYTIALLPLGVIAWWLGITGWVSAIFSVVPALVMLAAAINFSRTKTRERARTVFLLSITYLPVVLMMLVADSQHLGRFSGTWDQLMHAFGR